MRVNIGFMIALSLCQVWIKYVFLSSGGADWQADKQNDKTMDRLLDGDDRHKTIRLNWTVRNIRSPMSDERSNKEPSPGRIEWHRAKTKEKYSISEEDLVNSEQKNKKNGKGGYGCLKKMEKRWRS